MVIFEGSMLQETKMNQYWTERSKVTKNRIEHRLKMKNAVNGENNMIFLKGALKYLDVGTGPALRLYCTKAS